MNNNINIALVDDHNLFLKGLIELINIYFPLIKKVDVFGSPKKFLATDITKYNLLISDIQMPEMNGIELVELAKMKHPNLRVLMISMHNKYSFTKKIKSLGIEGFILKDDSEENLVNAIHKIMDGRKFYSEKIETHFEEVKATENVLSLREEQVLDYICEGLTSKQIAEEMFIAEETIKSHKRNIKAKLKISSTVELIKYNMRKDMF
ncbi:LuxR C-terminal-related transcriptional regulator [Flammeovirga kamogawensis]|uniref:Response regulator transcription factor n=1 Tax=Flammeovirga kamogawensis TaxID=373891 RepID=A0ABX8GQW6_9BACT|nr:response regulator transcription factor [Flammeovirga kamogawensis]MBB6463056.1 DNA-binding NarL/FixJ family response regulator [Flammeovirga kamogawensis]QWG05693.1 response regulator transcription factor [Flammeovirga kamogawensis]TRX67521.1 response regulator transcription factor [Flammeovirga kamogawensis]